MYACVCLCVCDYIYIYMSVYVFICVCVCVCKRAYIYLCITLVGRVFANGPEVRPKSPKLLLNTALLNTHRHNVLIIVKVKRP